MREIASESSAWVLYEESPGGRCWLRAVCNRSAAYFFVDIALLPTELPVLGRRGADGAPTESGRALLERLSRAAQSSPERFGARRQEAWRALGLDDAPPMPPVA